jgi:Reverse transcriptase (RNA-dependent DNA polymerase)
VSRDLPFFATFDLSQGYWQLSLDADSQDCQSFITPDGVFTPTRVLHGTTNAVPHMQACMQGILGDLSDSILAWLDDLLMHAIDENALRKLLCLFFKLCRDYNLKLHPGKCVLFSKNVRWCGRLISSDGVRFDPRRVQALHDMALPVTGGDLQQFVCALNWMRTSIPSFATIISPLQELLEEVYSHVGKRTKAAVSKILLSKVGWSKSHADSFRLCKQAIEHAVTLAHPLSGKRLCVYSDASSAFWSAVITQVPPIISTALRRSNIMSY